METQVIRIGIVAHTARASEARALRRLVGAEFISVDNGVMGCDANHDLVQRHLSALPADWVVVLEDDAVPVPGFSRQLSGALGCAPSPVVGLYLGRLRPPQYQKCIAAAVNTADREGADWVLASRLFHGVGYAIRADLLASLTEFPLDSPADERISEWALRNKHVVSYCWPSLVDHADFPTLIERHRDGVRRDSGRVAWRAGPHDGWSSVAVRVVGDQ